MKITPFSKGGLGGIKLATFNVNSVRARLPILASFLKKAAPDVLCMQETKVRDEDFPEAAFKELGYKSVFSGEKSYNGVAILSRLPMKNVVKGFPDGSEKARIIKVEVTVPPRPAPLGAGAPKGGSGGIKGITIVNTYAPQGEHPLSIKFKYKLEWFKKLYDWFDSDFNANSLLLWAGDFNVAPEAIDVHDPKRLDGHVGFHHDERAEIERFKEWGFVDVFRVHDKSQGKYTFWDYRAKDGVKRNLGWRVDHIFATPALAKKSVKAWIDMGPRLAEKPSDHTPLVAEFKV
ncbi:MAG: exodeoxyribonuclease III [Thermodesulfobacteriota bacterium]